MKWLNNRKIVSNQWFFRETPLAVRLLTQAYVMGDLLVLVPFLLMVLLVGIFSLRLMFLVYAVFFSLRQVGEMIYWLLQQFGDKNYRPYDFGLKNLGNNAIYILYQLLGLIGAVVGVTVIFLVIFSF